MALFDWPAELPQSPLLDGLTEELPDITIRTSFDSGVDQVRPRFSTGPRKFPIRMIMTSDQVQTFDNFYFNTLVGAAAFTYKHFRTGASGDFRFIGAPGPYVPIDGAKYSVSFTLEMLP